MLKIEQQNPVSACLNNLREDLGCDVVFLLNPQSGVVSASTTILNKEHETSMMALVIPYIMMNHRVMILRDNGPVPGVLRHEMPGYCYYLGYGSNSWVVVALSMGRLMIGLMQNTMLQCLSCLNDLLG